MKRFCCVLVCLILSAALFAAAVSAEIVSYQPMQYGDSGEQVALIQEQLQTLGYYEGQISGDYLDGTMIAVSLFQADYGLETTGMVDGETEALLFSAQYRLLTTGDSGDDVVLIQERLTALDYYNGKISGDYLEGTTYGIKLFQEKNGLEATGDADAETQRVLFSSDALSRYTKAGGEGSESADTAGEEQKSDYTLEYVGRITRGTQGNRIKQIQRRLTELGYFVGPISGNYMNQTMAAIEAFQANNGLKVDGITGADTWSMLFDLENAVDASATPRPTPEPTPIPYALTVDVKNQMVVAYALDDNGEHTVPYRYMVCSSGTVSNPSEVGEFVLDGSHAPWAFFSLYGSYAQYWTKITEDIAFHSVIYNRDGDPYSLNRKSYNMLGSRASHGCIRLLVHDAKWIYDNIGVGTVVTITEDLPLDPELRAALNPKDVSSNWDSAPVTPTPTAPPVYIADAEPPEFRKMKKGNSGEDVYWLQMKLRELGYYQGAMATGEYLDGTVKAVKAFQRDNDLSVDGVAGLKTLKAIYADVLATATPEPTDTPSPTLSPTPSLAE